uniref:Uncharacterized protein n=1 Tax=Anguilla anguilla TaxID=7936 RepID=A0A0E9PFC8_ANGAN
MLYFTVVIYLCSAKKKITKTTA